MQGQREKTGIRAGADVYCGRARAKTEILVKAYSYVKSYLELAFDQGDVNRAYDESVTERRNRTRQPFGLSARLAG